MQAMQAQFDHTLVSKESQLVEASRTGDTLRAELHEAERASRAAMTAAVGSAKAETERRHAAATVNIEAAAHRNHETTVAALKSELAASKRDPLDPPRMCPQCPIKQARIDNLEFDLERTRGESIEAASASMHKITCLERQLEESNAAVSAASAAKRQLGHQLSVSQSEVHVLTGRNDKLLAASAQHDLEYTKLKATVTQRDKDVSAASAHHEHVIHGA